MPVTYTNRKGVTYTLYRVIGNDGRPQYAFARRDVGEPVAELPAGFRINESPSGTVTLSRDQPALVQPEEISAVETAVQRHPQAQSFRVTAKQKQIEVSVRMGRGLGMAFDAIVAGLALPDQEAQMRALEEQFAHYAPVLRFTLVDPERRTFTAEQLVVRWGFESWRTAGSAGSVAALAQSLVPALDADEVVSPAANAPAIASPWPFTTQSERHPTRPRRRSRSRPASVHRLKVTLRGSKPPIWRRIVVPSDFTLGELHRVIQEAMGWDDSHLHDFSVGGMTYGDPNMVDDIDEDEWAVTLAEVVPRAKRKMRYMYDFGDSWDHDIVVEAVTPPDRDTRYPIVLAGARACPPDDCGGIWRYQYLVEIMADPDNPDPEALEEFLEWWGEPLNPEAFDLEAVNRRVSPGIGESVSR
jgi:hypothetical protein